MCTKCLTTLRATSCQCTLLSRAKTVFTAQNPRALYVRGMEVAVFCDVLLLIPLPDPPSPSSPSPSLSFHVFFELDFGLMSSGVAVMCFLCGREREKTAVVVGE
jgi:hypothetical protein